MTGSSAAPRRGLLARALGLPRSLWREVAGLAELFSDVGHGPRRWREGGPIESPYAGSGPDAPAGTAVEGDEPADRADDRR